MPKQYAAMMKHPGCVTVDGDKGDMRLPDGCTGIVLVFKTKKAARKWWGKDVKLLELGERVV